jgi:hypothetical protein
MACAAKLRSTAYFLFLILAALGLLNVMIPQANTQNSELSILSYQAFSQLAQVYRSGGSAPDLVAKLNVALAQIQEATILRAQGNLTGATKLEGQAQSTIADVEKAIPAAQLKAQQDSTTRTLSVLASIPIVVIISTLIFYGALRTWRWYERAKLFEMRIVEKKTED